MSESELPDTSEAVARKLARQDGVNEFSVRPGTERYDEAMIVIAAHREVLKEQGWVEVRPVKVSIDELGEWFTAGLVSADRLWLLRKLQSLGLPIEIEEK